MKTRFLFVVYFFSKAILLAQNSEEIIEVRPENSVYLNIAGDASFFSLNYEREFSLGPSFILTGKLGAGYNQEINLSFCWWEPCYDYGDDVQQYLTIPHHITGNIGKGRHFFEFGLGGTFLVGDAQQPYCLYPIVGYRLHPLQKHKIAFRFYAEIPLNDSGNIIFIPVGFSAGFTF